MKNLFAKSQRQTQQQISLELDSAQEPREFEELSDTDLEMVIGGDNTYSYRPRGYNKDNTGLLQVGLLEANGQGVLCIDLIGEDCDVEHSYSVYGKKP